LATCPLLFGHWSERVVAILRRGHFFWPFGHFFYESGQAETVGAQGFAGFLAIWPLFFSIGVKKMKIKEYFKIANNKRVCEKKWVFGQSNIWR
jgi:hypothetical protein